MHCVTVGIYIHVPFCRSKCPYCDFFSTTEFDDTLLDRHTAAIIAELERHRAEMEYTHADTLYFGGGTPTLLGGKRIACIIDAAARLYLFGDAEITLEANPGDNLAGLLHDFSAAGGNRLSIGMQSHDGAVLHRLGRRHTHADTEALCRAAHHAGIENISLDIMIGLEKQTAADVRDAVDTAAQLGARHLSAYILKIENGTPFYERKDAMQLPDDDESAELYLSACDAACSHGLHQYEISNFSLPSYESRHNLKYWNALPVIGIGAAAHSFAEGKRTSYPRDLRFFLDGGQPAEEPDTPPRHGSADEYMMLRLRLNDGVVFDEFSARFGYTLPADYIERARTLPHRLVECDDKGIRLTRDGFLLSNILISKIFEERF